MTTDNMQNHERCIHLLGKQGDLIARQGDLIDSVKRHNDDIMEELLRALVGNKKLIDMVCVLMQQARLSEPKLNGGLRDVLYFALGWAACLIMFAVVYAVS